MSLADYADTIDAAARYALVKAKAIEPCRFHPDITIRAGDENAERHAYALATTISKSNGTYWTRDDLLPAIKEQLNMAADECPVCAKNRDA